MEFHSMTVRRKGNVRLDHGVLNTQWCRVLGAVRVGVKTEGIAADVEAVDLKGT